MGAHKHNLVTGAFLDSFSASPGTLRLTVVRDGDDWRAGDAVTPHGLVGIYTQGRRSGRDPHTRLDIVVGGRLHIASWGRTFADRFLLTLAKRFAASVSALPPQRESDGGAS